MLPPLATLATAAVDAVRSGDGELVGSAARQLHESVRVRWGRSVLCVCVCVRVCVCVCVCV